MSFSDELLMALADWQKGWREKQSERERLSVQLQKVVESLDAKFKRVNTTCYRKRFLHEGELVDIVLRNEKAEGVVSWTIKQEFAERFKGLQKLDAVSGAIFEHTPTEDEVVINICELWKDQAFITAANKISDPTTLFSKYFIGSIIDSPASISAAKCITASNPRPSTS